MSPDLQSRVGPSISPQFLSQRYACESSLDISSSGQKTAQKRHEHLKEKKKARKRGGAAAVDDGNNSGPRCAAACAIIKHLAYKVNASLPRLADAGDVLDATAHASGAAASGPARQVKREEDCTYGGHV
jgi:hypothetical protein